MKSIRLLALTASATLLLAGEAQAQRRVTAQHEASPTGTVEISIGSGQLRVIGWNRREVQVTGTLQRSTDQVVVEGGGRSTEVRVDSRRGSPGSATLEVRVPAGSSVELATSSAPVTITGVTGTVEATNRNGSVVIQGNPRAVEITVNHGDVTLEGQTERATLTAMAGDVRVTGSVRERLEVNAVSGDVVVTGTVREAEVNAMNGDVSLSNVSGGRVEITSVSGQVRVSGTRLRGNVQSVSGDVTVTGTLGGALDVESHAGDVEVRLPRETGARVEISSWSGGVDSDWRLTRDGRDWRGTLGGGGPTLAITTFSGSVTLKRR